MCDGPHDFIPANATAKLELIYEVTSQRCENVVYIQRDGGWNADLLALLANSVEQAYIDNLAPQQGAAVDLVLVRATDVSADDSFGYEIEPSSAAVGARNEQIMPGNVTVVTKFATGRTGRSNRGRAYWVGLTEIQCGGNTLNGGYADAISAAWAGFFNDLNVAVAAIQHVVASYCHNGAWRSAAVLTRVTNYSTDFNLDSQRRRLNGRGQ